MLERRMEDLIAAYPADFFPRHKLTLIRRQGVFTGVGRFDLHFTDHFGTNVLMELKAVPARYEDASQLAKYQDAMKATGQERVLMWLVAPLIPPSVREFLSHIGIEYSEIHQSEFDRIAQLRGEFPGSVGQITPAIPDERGSAKARMAVTRKPAKGEKSAMSAWHFNTDEAERPGSSQRLLSRSVMALWGYPNAAAKLNRPRAGEAVLFYKSKAGVIAAGYMGEDPAVSSNDIFGEQDQYEFSRRVYDLIAVGDEHAVRAEELRTLGVTGPLLGALSLRYSAAVAEAVRHRLKERVSTKGTAYSHSIVPGGFEVMS